MLNFLRKKTGILKYVVLIVLLVSLVFCSFSQFVSAINSGGCLSFVSKAVFYNISNTSMILILTIFSFMFFRIQKRCCEKDKLCSLILKTNNFIVLFWLFLYKIFLSLFESMFKGKIKPQIYYLNFFSFLRFNY